MTDTITTEAQNANEQEVLELLLTGGEEGFITLLSRAAFTFTNGRAPQELTEEAQQYVLKALDIYAEALNVARTSAFLMAVGAPDEVVNDVASEGVPHIEEFERRKAEFAERWPEYSEWADIAEAAVASDVSGE